MWISEVHVGPSILFNSFLYVASFTDKADHKLLDYGAGALKTRVKNGLKTEPCGTSVFSMMVIEKVIRTFKIQLEREQLNSRA